MNETDLSHGHEASLAQLRDGSKAHRRRLSSMQISLVAAGVLLLPLLLAACGASDVENAAPSPEATAALEAPQEPSDVMPPESTDAPTADEATELEVTTVRYLQPAESMAYLPVTVALYAGLFEDEGLDIEVLPFTQQGAQVMLAGDVDIAAISTPNLFPVIEQDRGLVSLALLTPNPTQGLVLTNDAIERIAAETGVTPESPIEDRVQALEGLTITTPPEGSATSAQLMTTLQDFGVDPDGVRLTSLDAAIAHINTARAGQSDGYAFSPPVTTIATAEGFGQTWFAYYKKEIPRYDGVSVVDIVSTEDFITANPNTTTAFLRAVWNAIDLIESDPSAAAEATKEAFPDVEQEVFDQAFADVTFAFLDGILPTQEGFEKTLDALNISLESPVELTFEEVYDPSFAEAARPS